VDDKPHWLTGARVNTSENLKNAEPPSGPKGFWERHAWRILVLILLAALGLRLAYLWEIVASPTFTYAVYDPQYNDYWARGLVTGDWAVPEGVNDPEIRTTPYGRPPGYPFFLALVYHIFGLNYLAPRLVQIYLGLISAVLLFALARGIFGAATALLATAFFSCYWVFIYFEGVLTYPSVVVCLLLLVMLAIAAWLRRPNARRAAIVGLLIGLFALFRPNGLLYVPALIVWMGWILRRREMEGHGQTRTDTDKKKRSKCSAVLGAAWRSGAALLLGVALPLAPVIARNYVVARDFVFLSSYGGLNFYVGNHAGASGVEPRIPELPELAGIENWSCFDYPAIVRGLAAKIGKDHIRFSEANLYFYRKAFDFIRSDPAAFLRLTAKKALLFWGPREITNDTVMEWDKRHSPLLRWLPGFPIALGLFLAGLLIFFRDLRAGRALPRPESRATACAVLLFITAYFLSVVPYFIAGRYRVPIIPFMLLFGAYGAQRIGAMAAARQWRQGARWLGVAAALVAASFWNPTGYAPSEATWHFHQAMAHAARADWPAAAAHYRQCIALDPANAAAHNNLGRIHSRLGERDAALASFQAALRLRPEDPTIRNNLGFELQQLGRTAEAVAEYEAAVRAAPRAYLPRANLINALTELGHTEEALQHAAALVEMYGDTAATQNAYGYALARAGRAEEALPCFRKAIRINPRSVPAWINLGMALESLGRREEAADAYAQVLELEPANAHAQERLRALRPQQSP